MKTSKLLDQFYTKPQISKHCFAKINELVNLADYDLQLEPSAGTGSFFNLMTHGKRKGIDLDKKLQNIHQGDFFDFQPSKKYKRIITIGNPPFGKNSSLAVRFFNHAAQFSDVIAFIIPKTFKKDSLQNKLNFNFWLIHSEDLPKNSFIYNGESYDVPCCFQVWIKKVEKRKKVVIDLNNNFIEFVSKSDSPDFAVRRVGGTAGKCKLILSKAKEVSHYFIRIKQNSINKSELVNYINNLDFYEIVNSTAGVRSLSKQEFIKVFMQNFDIQRVTTCH